MVFLGKCFLSYSALPLVDCANCTLLMQTSVAFHCPESIAEVRASYGHVLSKDHKCPVGSDLVMFDFLGGKNQSCVTDHGS